MVAASTAHRARGAVPHTEVGVLDRAMEIIQAVEGGARTFTDVREATGLPRSTAHRLLRSMEAHGLLTFVGGHGYRLGTRLLNLSRTAVRELPLRDLAQPILDRLARTTGESAQLYVRDADRRLCIAAAQSDSELRAIVEVGAALPLTAGSAGKVFLAFGAPTLTSQLLAEATPITPRTPTGEQLDRQLAAARRFGWASSAGEREPGVGSVSAPIFEPLGALLAVVSLSGPEQRIGRISAKRYSPAVLEAAKEIEGALGA
ncbi:MAG TPA: IclR family transcriptional regulator [Actinomycetota bacterium]|nr:IclR family transcriptional regulator [Actinomycetota bacterium]